MDLEADALDWAFVGHLLVDPASPLYLDNAFVVRRQGQAQFVVKTRPGAWIQVLGEPWFHNEVHV